MTISLPRSFKGLLTSTASHGSANSPRNMSDGSPLIMSYAMAEHVETISEINSTKICFVGDLSEFTEGEESWSGDEVSLVTKNGRVQIRYTDEVMFSDFMEMYTSFISTWLNSTHIQIFLVVFMLWLWLVQIIVG